VEITEEDYLAHYGIIRRSGRYPWGSGGNELENHQSFISMINGMKKKGLTDKEIAEGIGIPKGSTTTLREMRGIAKNAILQSEIAQIERLRAKGMSNPAIGRQMGLPESTVRARQKEGQKDRANILDATTNMLKQQIAEKKYIDIGSGVEFQLNISDTKLKQAVTALLNMGYNKYYVKVRQLGTGKETSIKVLADPDSPHPGSDPTVIQQISQRSGDGGRSYLSVYPPLSISARRVGINYQEDGGADADGVIYVRPDVKDLSMGNARYAQVRIQVGPSHYIKGMAMYKDDLPEGVDLLFNTNKSKAELGSNKLKALKPLNKDLDGNVDQDNPFGATISNQLTRVDRNGKVVVTSVMNIVNEEGDWSKWSKNLSSQMLSKQPTTLAKAQLAKAYEQRRKEYEELSALTNPAVKRKLLETFGDEADAAAVHLKAAALGQRQGSHVILPINSMKPTEVYAPNYENGERVVLIRYPHGGRFEIPELVVNNKQPEARRLLKDARDAIGIHKDVAERMSGADFDGDTVMVIPNNQGRVKTAAMLKGLQDFDPRSEYRAYEGMPQMTPKQKGAQMGDISNLITDMTIKGASPSEITRAVKHSMVVIDAEKHHLDYKLSAEQNGIRALKAKYQGGPDRGASTLISLAGGDVYVPDTRTSRVSEGGAIDPKTGKKNVTPTGESYTNKDGKVVVKLKKVQRLSITDDAHDLVSKPTGQPMERIYADHSNKLKALGNQARLDLLATPKVVKSPSAAKVYAQVLAPLDSRLAIAERNAPYERQAQIIGNATYKQKLAANPTMDDATKKKVKGQAIVAARARVGAKKEKIYITDVEWEAIQAGAISDTKLTRILGHADLDRVKELASPRHKPALSKSGANRAQAMLNAGKTRGEVAAALGISLTTLDTVTDAKGGEMLK